MSSRMVLFSLAILLALPSAAFAQSRGPQKRVLVYTRSQGFEHSTAAAGKDEEPFLMGVLTALGLHNNWVIEHTKDGAAFTPENLARFDGFFFSTTGDLTAPRLQKDGSPYPADDVNQKPMSAAGKAALLEAIAKGKGFVAIHNASDTFHSAGERWAAQSGDTIDPYIKMLGGEFIRHGKQQKARVRIVNPRFPGFAGLGPALEFHEEWYSLKNQADDLHVLLVLETAGMEGSPYARPPFPAAWARRHDKGRVFYTTLGHREDVWTHPAFQKMLEGGMRWALGQASANVMPNVKKVTPEFHTLPVNSSDQK